jgi:hypothetical protein
MVVMGFLLKEGLSEESGQQGRRRDKETPAARSRREGIFEHQRRNMAGKWWKTPNASSSRVASPSPRPSADDPDASSLLAHFPTPPFRRVRPPFFFSVLPCPSFHALVQVAHFY